MTPAAATEGVLEASFRRDARGRSTLQALRQRFPLRMTVPFYLDRDDPGMAFVYVQNPTGGVFAGDRLHTAVRAAGGARVHLTTQSATKLYRMEGGEARQELRFELAPGAYVEHVPDPLIPQAGARFSQRTIVDLAPGSAFVAAETVAPGRRAHGERFAYDSVALSATVRLQGRELCAETLRLEPGRRAPDRPGALGGRDYLVSLMAVGGDGDAGALAARLDAAVAAQDGVAAAAGELPNGAGAIVRALAADARAARRVLLAAWAVARSELVGLGLPGVRK